MKARVRWAAEVLAARATKWIGVRWGDSFPFYYVAEYPKSGGTWLCRMLSDYLEIPFPRYSLLPATFSSVVQYFGRHHPRLRRVFYLYRDGRDVMTSLYYDRVRVARHTNRPARRAIARTYEKLFGAAYDPEDIVRHMPVFIEYEFSRPGRGSPLNWQDHVDDWVQPGWGDRIAYLRYEDLLADCAGALAPALEQVTGSPADSWRLSTTVEKMSMQRSTGRQPGEADAKQHLRKGVAGDWRNAFSREAADVFQALAGEALLRLGYEEDARWVERYDYPTP